ncbi:MAG: hypothetical protein HZB37_02720 [Planctomycetes bacterium]|nr:hypothetical protein [Planctomycetota bacterium]
MSSCNTKAKAIMVVLVGIFGLLCVGFAVSVTEKYKLQKERVHALERQLGAGRKEVLKVPELMENLDKVAAEKKEVEEKFATCASEKEGLTSKVAELQKEVDTFGAIKVAVGVQIGGAQNTIMEQQNKLNGLEEARNKLSEQIAALEAENKKITDQSAMQIIEVKRGNEDAKNQLVYYIEAKKIADKEIADKQKAIADLQHAKEALEGELAKIKEKAPSAAPQGSSSSICFNLYCGCWRRDTLLVSMPLQGRIAIRPYAKKVAESPEI